jgi:hypothetical protein
MRSREEAKPEGDSATSHGVENIATMELALMQLDGELT